MFLVRTATITGCGSLFGAVAQMVEQWTENPCVGGSIPSRTTTLKGKIFHSEDYDLKNCSPLFYQLYKTVDIIFYKPYLLLSPTIIIIIDTCR